MDARRQRMRISQSQVNWVVVIPVPAGRLRATGDRHGPQRQSARFCHHNGLFATGVAASALLIAAYDRPFIGDISVGPGPLLQVIPSVEGHQVK